MLRRRRYATVIMSLFFMPLYKICQQLRHLRCLRHDAIMPPLRHSCRCAHGAIRVFHARKMPALISIDDTMPYVISLMPPLTSQRDDSQPVQVYDTQHVLVILRY